MFRTNNEIAGYGPDGRPESVQAKEHFDKYEALAIEIGLPKLRWLVLNVVADAEAIRAALETDPHLNNIGGSSGVESRWDRASGWSIKVDRNEDLIVKPVAPLAVGTRWLSNAEGVYALKHVARYHLEDGPAIEDKSQRKALLLQQVEMHMAEARRLLAEIARLAEIEEANRG